MITQWRFSRELSRRRSRPSLKTKISRRSLKFVSVYYSGTDGGAYQSFAAGKNWDHLNRIPSGEFYRISLDDTKPYFRIAGGLQDNENWAGPSSVQSKEGIRNCDWTALAGGDGFYVLFDPTDRDTFTPKASKAKCTGSIWQTARYGVCRANRLKVSLPAIVTSTGNHQ